MTNETKPDGGPAFPVDRHTAHGIAVHEVGTKNEAAYIEAVARLSHGMSKREYAAIMLKVPDSGTDWLDAMIRTAQRNELAARAMPEILRELWDNAKSAGASYEAPVEELAAKFSYEVADAMQKASNP